MLNVLIRFGLAVPMSMKVFKAGVWMKDAKPADEQLINDRWCSAKNHLLSDTHTGAYNAVVYLVGHDVADSLVNSNWVQAKGVPSTIPRPISAGTAGTLSHASSSSSLGKRRERYIPDSDDIVIMADVCSNEASSSKKRLR